MSSGADDAQSRMDRMYRHQRRIYDVTRCYYLLGRSHLLDDLDPPPGGTVLEVGCGTAANLLGASQRYPSARFHGFDISTEMLATARKSVERDPRRNAISLAIGDATDFDTRTLFGVAAVDRIFTSYTLSMIPRWDVVLDQMVGSLAPDGSIHVVDFGDCAGLPSFAKALLYGWLDKFDVTPRQNLHDVLQSVATKHDLHLTFSPLFRGYAQYGVLSRQQRGSI